MQSRRAGSSISLCPLVLVSLFGVLLIGCGKKQKLGVQPEFGDAHRQAIAASNDLALRLYRELRATPGNVVVSPYGVSSSLSMLAAGASGTTREELLSVLGASVDDEPQYHTAQAEMVRWLSGDEDVSRDDDLRMALGVFIQKGHELATPFVKTAREEYGVEPEAVDFVKQPATARKVINDWSAEKTNGKISEVISPDDISGQTRMVLASSVYFKGAWKDAFERSRTRKSPFQVSSDREIDVDMMSQKGQFGYVHADGVRILIMPYRGGDFSMVAVLPDEIDGLSALEERIDGKTLTQWIETAATRAVELPVWLPRFRFANRHDLESALKKLGITAAFDPMQANFSRMVDPENSDAGDELLFVDRVRQQALIEVNEEGTEAAAVTTIRTEKTEKAPRDPPMFRADHPFLFLIRENDTGLILFLGRVADPTKE